MQSKLTCAKEHVLKMLTLLAWSAARMWPYITEAAEREAKAMLPDMLKENKPTWMTKLELHE